MNVWRTVIRRVFAVGLALLGATILGGGAWWASQPGGQPIVYLIMLSLGALPCLSWAWLLWWGCSFRQGVRPC